MSSADEHLADRVLPRRAAATKASRLAAEQLALAIPELPKSGAIRLFGEPSRTRRRVKVTYSSEISDDQVPTAQSREQNEAVKHTVRKQRSFPPSSSHSRARKAQSSSLPWTSSLVECAAAGFDDDDALTSLSESDSDIEIIDEGEFLKASNSAQRKNRQKQPRTGFAARSAVISVVPSEGYSLTRKRRMSYSEAEVSSSASEPVTSLFDIKSASRLRATKSSAALLPSSYRSALHKISPERKLDDVGRYVWVRIDRLGDITESVFDTLWWPAKVLTTCPLRVQLFGNRPGSSGSGADPGVIIPKPSPLSVLPLMTSDRLVRFTEDNFMFHAQPEARRDSVAAPRKRQKTSHVIDPDPDMKARWKEARRLMLKEDMAENDGLPSVLSLYEGGNVSIEISSDGSETMLDEKSPPPSKGKGKWVPPTFYHQYEIPGELVLARERKKDTCYWPAKLARVVPPTSPWDKVKFEVLFFDGTMKMIPKDMFYTEDEEEFDTCKLGDTENNYGLDEEERDQDDHIDYNIVCEEDEDTLRAPSPEPALPAPDAYHFPFQSIMEQINYIKPILISILNVQYEPARERHEAWMKDGGARKTVSDTCHDTGELSAGEVNEIHACILRWVCRRQKRQAMGLLPPDEDSNSQTVLEQRETNTTLAEDENGESDNLPLLLSQASGDTEPASDPPLPPSSFITIEGSENDGDPPDIELLEEDGHVTAESTTEVDEIQDIVIADFDASNSISKPLHSAKDRPEDTPLSALRSRPRKYFASLAKVDQIAYCTDILLHEAILQLLLWRSGSRQSISILSAAEEEELHNLAKKKALESYWVHDIIRSRRAINHKLLPSKQPQSPNVYSRTRSGKI